jgi:hypothetical protein
MNQEDDFGLYESHMPQEAFHLEMDLYDTGMYSNLLCIPCDGVFIVVSNNEHLTSLIKDGIGADAWEQRDGQLEDEILEKLAIALEEYIRSQ